MKKFLLMIIIVMCTFTFSYSENLNFAEILGMGFNIQQIEQDPEQGKKYIIFIDDIVFAPKVYRPISTFLMTAKSEDTIIFRINTPGGNLNSAIMLYNDIIKCKALTIADIYVAYSAGAIIAMACEQIKVNILSRMMIHNLSFYGMVGGSIGDIKKQVDDINAENIEINTRVFQTFLTKEELQRVLEGENLFLNEKQLRKKLKFWMPVNVKYRETK